MKTAIMFFVVRKYGVFPGSKEVVRTEELSGITTKENGTTP